MNDDQPQRPTTDDDPAVWRAYWQALGMPWRAEPEIGAERQQFLAERRAIEPDFEQSIYPFKDVTLTRADVEWLLATLESGGMRGPLEWKDETQRTREGLDLRGADLRHADLANLPLAHMNGGLPTGEAPLGIGDLAASQMESIAASHEFPVANAILAAIAKERSGPDGFPLLALGVAQLEGADLSGASLEAANFSGAHLEGANLSGAHLEGANLSGAHAAGANLHATDLKRASLMQADLAGVNLSGAHLEGANLVWADLRGKRWHRWWASKNESARVRQWLGDMPKVLPPADLKAACLDGQTKLDYALLGRRWPRFDLRWRGAVAVADTRWGEANLANVNWAAVKRLRDEIDAHQRKNRESFPVFDDALTRFRTAMTLGMEHSARKTIMENDNAMRSRHHGILWRMIGNPVHSLDTRLKYDSISTFSIVLDLLMRAIGGAERIIINYRDRTAAYESAVRANRQLANALQSQGLNEHAAYFAYRAQLVQRHVLVRKFKLVRYVFSLFLDALAGYGYHPWKSLVLYAVIILGFAERFYSLAKGLPHPFTPVAALVFSVSSFHGRGFFPGPDLPLDDPLPVLAAVEAIVGLLIEISFIATFTQRFFGSK